ncbi:hypothetical protein [Nonomuraea zeae]|uniref:hypothetical protein n=1 Tax=Nonomuraea zeae TaxID=1642303 RepID=UPI00197D400D|nr:hypothetical protein [Nonomuraea zeae]
MATSRIERTYATAPERIAFMEGAGLPPVDARQADKGTRVTMTMDAMHDEEWTRRLLTGRANELDNLGRVAGV